MTNYEENNVNDQVNGLNNEGMNNPTSDNLEPKTEEVPSKEYKKDNSTLKSSLIGGATGIVLGAVSTVLTGATVLPDDNIDGGKDDNHNETEIHFATTVNDDMTYSEAFAAARQEVGPGGAFVWHGTVYGTYYGTEWNAMSPEEQAEFSQNAIAQQPSATHPQTATDNQQSNNHHHSNTHHQAEPQNHQQHEEHHETVQEQHSDAVEVEVEGVQENVELEDGTIVNIGTATIEGHDAAFIDVDNDGTFDIVGVDENNDGIITENEISELSQDSGMSVDNFHACLGDSVSEQPTGDILADTGYSNDDNPTDFA